MNSDNHHQSCCCCCCGGTRERPRPQNTCSLPYYDPPIVPDCVCGKKACSIFGTHDLNPPSITCGQIKKSREKANTLGSPIGLVMSSITVRASDSLQLRYAICLKSFAKIFLSPEREWTTAVIDQLMTEGKQLVTESQKFDQNADNFSPPEIYSDVEAKIRRNFQLTGCSFTVELSEKYRVLKTDMETIGDDITPDISLQFLKTTIKQFFAIGKYCLLKVANLYFMIWKSRGVYFVFDCNGRRPADFNTDREKGYGMLICLKALSNVCHLLKNLSDLGTDDTFSLREIKVVKLVGIDGKVQNRDFGKRTNQYEIVNPDFALLRAKLHLTLNIADIVRNRSALPTSVATLLASKIDHPATWNQKMLDKIMCFGYSLCKTGWCHCRSSGDPIQIALCPTQLTIGQFIAGFLIIGPIYKGIWRCVPNFDDTDMSRALKAIIESNGMNFIIQLDHQFYAIWKKNNFIYFMDVYRHRLQIPVGDNEDHKSAALRMFRTIEMFLKIFHIVVLESTRTTNFFVYKVLVKKLNLVVKCEGVPEDDMPLQEDEEVKSLNETICFEEDDTKCTAELGEISDYEDDDFGVELTDVRKEVPSESDEVEEGMEEEEMGLEDFGEYESSSSGGGGHRHGRGRSRGRGKGGRGKTRSERDKQLRKSSKGGKKGKGAKDGGEKRRKGKGIGKDKTGKKLKERKDGKVSEKKGKKDKKSKDKKQKDKNKAEKDGKVKKKKDATGKESKGKKEKGKKEKETKEKQEKDKKDKKGKGKGKDDKESGDEKGEGKDKRDKKKKKGQDESDDEDPSKKKAKKDKKGKKDGDSDDENEEKKTGKKRKKRGDESDSEPESSKAKKKKVSKDKEGADDKTKTDKDKKNIGKDVKPAKEEEGIITKTMVASEYDQLPGKTPGSNKYGTSDRDRYGERHIKEEPGIRDDRGYKRSGRYDDEDDEDEYNRDIVGCKANSYPGYSTVPRDMAVVGSESGSYESICKLLRAGFKCADRILTMTPWGNYVVFRGYDGNDKIYFLFDGCTCNVNRFRHLDLNCGTAGLLCFRNLHDVICYILDSHKIRTNLKKSRKNIVDEICKQYCNK